MAIINDSQLAFTLQKQTLIFLGYAVLLSVLFFIPDAVEFEYGGVAGIAGYDARSMDPLDLGVPVWTTALPLPIPRTNRRPRARRTSCPIPASP